MIRQEEFRNGHIGCMNHIVRKECGSEWYSDYSEWIDEYTQEFRKVITASIVPADSGVGYFFPPVHIFQSMHVVHDLTFLYVTILLI